MLEKVIECNLLGVCMANAKVMYKQQSRRNINIEKFQLDINYNHSFAGEGYENFKPTKEFRKPASNLTARLNSHHFVCLNPHRRPNDKWSNPDSEDCSNRDKKRHQTSH